MSKAPIPSWRIIAAQIMAATKADPDSLRSIYDDKEFRPGRNATVWAQLSARLAQQRKAYREAVAKGCLKEVQHNMLRRCFAHEYTCPGSYMITIAVPQRGSNPFGIVKGDVRQGRKGITIMPEAISNYAALAHDSGPLRLELTPLGAAVLQSLEGINANYPMVKVRKAQIMPDHLHLILEVTAPIVSSNGTPRHLGHVIGGFKKGCNRRYWQLFSMGEPWNTATTAPQRKSTAQPEGAERFPRSAKRVPSTASTGRPSLWAEGYTDTIILSRQHMATEEAYLDDNIYRLRMKQLHRDLFRIVHHIRINGKHFAALTMGIPYIRLTREGFRDLYTPTKSEFEACCEGNLLILAPWEDRRRTTTITRRECMELNHIAAAISADNLELTLINENNNDDTIIPRDDE